MPDWFIENEEIISHFMAERCYILDIENPLEEMKEVITSYENDPTIQYDDQGWYLNYTKQEIFVQFT